MKFINMRRSRWKIDVRPALHEMGSTVDIFGVGVIFAVKAASAKARPSWP